MSEGRKIYLTLLNGTGYIFSVDDYIFLRQKHRMVGAAIGKGWSKGWSVHEMAMPVELSPWETQLLIDEGIAVLVSKKCSLLREPTSAEQQDYTNAVAKCRESQMKGLMEEKVRETEKNMDRILDGKRKKLLKQGKKEEDASEVLAQVAANFTSKPNDLLVPIHMAHDRAHEGEVVLPTNNLDPFKYRVYRDIWSRGNFVTCGDTFGADFLNYPGDPMLYHSSEIIVVMAKPVICLLDLIAKVRLSVTVNKDFTLAYESCGTNDADGNGDSQVCYQTVRWLGKRQKKRNKREA